MGPYLCELGSSFFNLQIYLFDRVKSRDFGQAWSVFLLCQSLPAALGVPAASLLDALFAGDGGGVARAGSLAGGALVLAAFAVVFLSNCLREESSAESRPRYSWSNPLKGSHL